MINVGAMLDIQIKHGCVFGYIFDYKDIVQAKALLVLNKYQDAGR